MARPNDGGFWGGLWGMGAPQQQPPGGGGAAVGPPPEFSLAELKRAHATLMVRVCERGR